MTVVSVPAVELPEAEQRTAEVARNRRAQRHEITSSPAVIGAIAASLDARTGDAA